MNSDIKMLEKFNLATDERTFIDNVNASRNPQFNDRLLPAYQIMADMYLMKQIEKSTEQIIESNEALAKANGKYADSLNKLTFFLVILTIILVGLTIVMLMKM